MLSLIEKLKAKQQEAGLSDGAFAESLGISRSMWQFTKSNERRAGDKLIRGVLKTYPEMAADVLILLQTATVPATQEVATLPK